jgi:hypothetical protein
MVLVRISDFIVTANSELRFTTRWILPHILPAFCENSKVIL